MLWLQHCGLCFVFHLKLLKHEGHSSHGAWSHLSKWFIVLDCNWHSCHMHPLAFMCMMLCRSILSLRISLLQFLHLVYILCFGIFNFLICLIKYIMPMYIIMLWVLFKILIMSNQKMMPPKVNFFFPCESNTSI
jgi:hypothetical protein